MKTFYLMQYSEYESVDHPYDDDLMYIKIQGYNKEIREAKDKVNLISDSELDAIGERGFKAGRQDGAFDLGNGKIGETTNYEYADYNDYKKRGGK
jgi:hypothetical protein